MTHDYIAEYECGCSASATTRRALLEYCGQHGANRIRVICLRTEKQQRRAATVMRQMEAASNPLPRTEAL